MKDGTYECKGCGNREVWLARNLYKGPLYIDTINNSEPYCTKCSDSFYRADTLPDGVVREEQ